MGSYLNQPITHVNLTTLQFQQTSSKAYAASLQGWRKNMEDYYIHLKINEQITLLGVFDGHGGPEVACYVSRVLPKELKIQPNFKLNFYEKALIKTFKRVDQMLISERGQEALRKIQKQLGAHKTPNDKKIALEIGCTANVVLITPTKIFCANIGDSRSMLIRRDSLETLSEDHKPTNPYEKNRIKKAGGKVNNGRINNGLNISRSFGDFALKNNQKKPYNQQMVTSIPQIIEFERSQEQQKILIASDGIWENFHAKNEKLGATIRSQILKSNGKYEEWMPQMLKKLVSSSQTSQYGCDNMTLLIAVLKNKND